MDEDECTYVFECQSLFRAKILCQETHLLLCVYCFSVTNILENVVVNVGEIVADKDQTGHFVCCLSCHTSSHSNHTITYAMQLSKVVCPTPPLTPCVWLRMGVRVGMSEFV